MKIRYLSAPIALRSVLILGMVLLISAASGLVQVQAADVVGTVKSVDLETKTIVVNCENREREVIVKLTDETAIEVQGQQWIRLDRLRPGTRVVVHDDVVASTIRVEGEVIGTVESVDRRLDRLTVRDQGSKKSVSYYLTPDTEIEFVGQGPGVLNEIQPGQPVLIVHDQGVPKQITVEPLPPGVVGEFWHNVRHNLFKPLLLFFYAGFLIPLLGVKFEFPYAIYQGLTIYLLIAIGWHGGEELAMLDPASLGQAVGFMGVGFCTNLAIGLLAYVLIRSFTKVRRVDSATVAGYYGSDSAGTFVTCLGVLASLQLAYAPYMPVLLAVMEIPGCLVALGLVSMLRKRGMDALGNLPGEPGYQPSNGDGHGGLVADPLAKHELDLAMEAEAEMALERTSHDTPEELHPHQKPPGIFSRVLLHEVFLNPGIYLLFAGILIGFISRLQGSDVTSPDDRVFLDLFPGLLCLFLLEMGMTASRKLKDLKTAGPAFIAFGLIAPNVFATIGIGVAHAYSMALGQPFELGTYALFAVLCGAASYIAVPAVQRLAIPEASPTLPLAASLGLTFTYNVTIGIPVYIEIAKLITRSLPVG